jgi:peptidoglycan/LPS O-acetylase OafA/YrhL
MSVTSAPATPTVAADIPRKGRRIVYLDGLRGVAIVLVLVFHSYARWSDRIPALKPFEQITLINTKSAGVQLFFFISGFVILMTLERTTRLSDFLYARWRRLFPAMFICSLIIFATAGLLPDRPAGQPRLVDLLPGLTLLGNRFWEILSFAVSPSPRSLEGAFWSLYVEVVFYLFFGTMLILRGRQSAIRWLIGIGTVTSLCYVNGFIPYPPFTWIARADKLLHISHVASIFGLTFYLWFAAGALAFLATREPDNRRLTWGALGCLALGAATTLDYPAASFLVALIAAGAILSPHVRWLLSWRLLTFFGFISYPLYLNHENLIVALMVQIQAAWPGLPAILLPLVPMAIAIGLATIVATYLEPVTRRLIDRIVSGGAVTRHGAQPASEHTTETRS